MSNYVCTEIPSQKNRKFSFAKYTKLQITCVQHFIPHSTDSDTGQDRRPLCYSKLHVSMTTTVKHSVAEPTEHRCFAMHFVDKFLASFDHLPPLLTFFASRMLTKNQYILTSNFLNKQLAKI